jgi:hypothetical protein
LQKVGALKFWITTSTNCRALTVHQSCYILSNDMVDIVTSWHGCNIPNLYSKCGRFESRLGHWDTDCPELFVFFSVPSGKYMDSVSRLGHDHFILSPFQSIFHLSSYNPMIYRASILEKASLNNPRTQPLLSDHTVALLMQYVCSITRVFSSDIPFISAECP